MIRIGTSGYNYPEWRGSFYPEKYPAAKMLRTTPSASTVESTTRSTARQCQDHRWLVAERRQGSPSRSKCLSESRTRAPAQHRRPAAPFSDTAAGSPTRLRALPAPPNFKKDLERLGGPGPATRRVRCAFEFRHESWSPTMSTSGCVPVMRRLSRRHGERHYPRGHRGLGYFRLRDQGYTAAGLEEWSRPFAGSAAAGATPCMLTQRRPGLAPPSARQLEGFQFDSTRLLARCLAKPPSCARRRRPYRRPRQHRRQRSGYRSKRFGV
jgi:hypothetical protein